VDQDQDGDGQFGDPTCPGGTAVDCDDTDPSINPGAMEVCDGLDNDCDSLTDPPDTFGCTVYFQDGDGDGYGDDTMSQCLCAPSGAYVTTIGGDCDDTDPTVYPGAPEVCNDGIDNDCDALTDCDDPICDLDPVCAGSDMDGDGVDDSIDVCNNTPPNTAVDALGRPLGDIDLDCDTDLNDFNLFSQGFTGSLNK
jgi:hypothetical protein